MKNKSLLAKLICTCVVTSLFIMPISAAASTNDNKTKIKQQEVYSQEYIDAAWAKAKSKPVMPDKVATNASTNSIVSLTSTGTYPTRNGVILATSDFYKGLIPTGHSGIIWDGAHGMIIEALSNGVVKGNNDWNIKKSTCWGVTVNGTTSSQDNEASNFCRAKLGKPYNYFFNIPYRTDAYYCSQLVWQSFLPYGYNLNTPLFDIAVHPMELVWSPNTRIVYEK
jgi:uncharacterized protein YycO